MKNPILIIYDNAGQIWQTVFGVTSVPTGIQGVVVDAPKNFSSVSIDPKTKKVTFGIAPDTEQEVSDILLALTELDERISALEDK